jgi:hypothetical protein
MTKPERINPKEMKRAVSGFNLPEGTGLSLVLSINWSIFLSWY